jgi:hypothetical protein
MDWILRDQGGKRNTNYSRRFAFLRQIDEDFAENRRLNAVAEEVHADIRAGRLQDLP